MSHEDFSGLLESHGIKPTANRLVVAKALALAQRPLSLSELERQILSIDKSGVFRTLTLFREHHLVHTIDDGAAGTRYELCHSHSRQHDDDLHVHFFCERCQRTFCLEQTAVPTVELPEGFSMTSASYLVKGICDECRQ